MKIGIYSGQIPPSIFIDQMICGLAKTNCTLYIYGTLRGEIDHYHNLSIKIRRFPKSKVGNILSALWLIIRFSCNKKYSSITIIKQMLLFSRNWKQFLIRCNRILLPFLDNLDVLHFQWAKDIVKYPEFIEQLDCSIALSLRGTHINVSPVTDKSLAILYRKYFPKINKFHAVSQAIAEEAGKYGADIDKITVINPAVNKTIFKHNNKNIKKTNTKSLNIVSIGRFHWIKGYTYALDAMSILKTEGINFHYTIISSDLVSENIQYQLNDLDLGDYIEIIYGLSNDKVIEQLPNYDLLILPSFKEGISNAVLEAMALRVPVVSTNCGGMSEIINHNENGFLIPIRDSIKLAEEIKKFIKMSESKILKIVDAAEQTIKDNYLLDHQVNKMMQIYKDPN